MSVKIRQCFRVTDRIRVEDGQHFKREREREDVDDGEGIAMLAVVAGGGLGWQRGGWRLEFQALGALVL
jgi:hypothetical protein